MSVNFVWMNVFGGFRSLLSITFYYMFILHLLQSTQLHELTIEFWTVVEGVTRATQMEEP